MKKNFPKRVKFIHSLHTIITELKCLVEEAFFFYRYTNELACEFRDLD